VNVVLEVGDRSAAVSVIREIERVRKGGESYRRWYGKGDGESVPSGGRGRALGDSLDSGERSSWDRTGGREDRGGCIESGL
jgi:hypothetical protein